MEKIKLLQTNLVNIYQVDDINLDSIRRKEFIDVLNEQYKLKKEKIPSLENLPNNLIISSVLFRDGEYINNKNVYIIKELSIDSRRIVIKMISPSEISDMFLSELTKLFYKFDTREEKIEMNSIITTYETICICKLDFDYSRFFLGSPVDKFKNNITSKFSGFDSKNYIYPYSLTFKIEYFDVPEKYRKNKIALLDKELRIELRDRSDPGNNIFFTVSPTDTKTHFEILKELELAIK